MFLICKIFLWLKIFLIQWFFLWLPMVENRNFMFLRNRRNHLDFLFSISVPGDARRNEHISVKNLMQRRLAVWEINRQEYWLCSAYVEVFLWFYTWIHILAVSWDATADVRSQVSHIVLRWQSVTLTLALLCCFVGFFICLFGFIFLVLIVVAHPNPVQLKEIQAYSYLEITA